MTLWKDTIWRKTGNILDPIHDELDQRVFRGTDPRPSVVRFIENNFKRQIAARYGDSLPSIDLYFTGSLTTYQYSDSSDVDISIIPQYELYAGDPKVLRKDLIAFVIDKLDGAMLPGTPHPLQHFIVPPGTGPQDLFKPGMRSAWSFQDHEWVVPPERQRVHDISHELPGMYQRAQMMAEKMRNMLSYSPDRALELFHQIHKKRSWDQQHGLGDFSEGNIVYKFLLHEGLFDKLRELGEYIAKTADFNPVQFMVDQIAGSGGNVEKVRQYWLKMPNLKYSPEELSQHINEAAGIYERNEADVADMRAYLKEKMDAQKQIPFIEYRWAWYKGHTVIQNVSEAHGGNWDKMIHYDMLAELGLREDQLFDYDNNMETQRVVPDLYLGYAAWDGEAGVDMEGDDSLDYLNATAEPTPEAKRDVENAILEDVKKNGFDKLASEKVQVIYDFEKDRIILGTKEGGPPRSQIIGEYDGSNVVLYHTDQAWINAKYFKRLWFASYPNRPLKKVILRDHDDSHRHIGMAAESYGYVTTFIYDIALDKLHESPYSEHGLLMEEVWADHPEWENDEGLVAHYPDEDDLVMGWVFKTRQGYNATFSSLGYSELGKGNRNQHLALEALAKIWPGITKGRWSEKKQDQQMGLYPMTEAVRSVSAQEIEQEAINLMEVGYEYRIESIADHLDIEPGMLYRKLLQKQLHENAVYFQDESEGEMPEWVGLVDRSDPRTMWKPLPSGK
jgi:hypothetical protein